MENKNLYDGNGILNSIDLYVKYFIVIQYSDVLEKHLYPLAKYCDVVDNTFKECFNMTYVSWQCQSRLTRNPGKGKGNPDESAFA
jgi:hypothetical protein